VYVLFSTSSGQMQLKNAASHKILFGGKQTTTTSHHHALLAHIASLHTTAITKKYVTSWFEFIPSPSIV
jgi:hypothetical protein